MQAEALVSMLEMYKLTGKPEYYDAFAQTLDFVEKHQVAKEGSWWATRKADGSPAGTARTSMWQGGVPQRPVDAPVREAARRTGRHGEVNTDRFAIREQTDEGATMLRLAGGRPGAPASDRTGSTADRIGIFEGHGTSARCCTPGPSKYDAAAKTYTVTGSGENMWFAEGRLPLRLEEG